MNKDNMRRDEAIIGTTQVVEALCEQGHKVIGRETITEFEQNWFGETTIKIPNRTKRIVVIYLD